MISHMSTIDVGELFSLKGKVALVTGGSRGIGRMIAEGYVKAGARVYISARKKEACDQTAEELSRFGECVSLPADASSAEGRALLVKTLSEREEGLHILVNNAGANWGAPFEEFPEKGFHKVIDLNLIAVFFLTRDLTPLLERAASADDPARVINIGSMDGVHVPTIIPTGVYAYSSSKAAVHHLSRHLAVELGPRHITVNAVAPGYFESKMTAEVLDEYGDEIRGACPMDRIGRPEEMAGVAIYLASRAGAYTNGTVIPVDGGTCIN
jgi:NAD(P)-dependent dehydrogenase (short-subunit alcohol dehydrogenase family)